MFKFLRSNAKFFYWIIAATFIAFIFLAWGMDVAGQKSTGGRAGAVVGKVDGVEISAYAYDSTVREIQASFRRNAPDRPLNANQVALAQQQAWDQLVREQIMMKEIVRLGIVVTNDEIRRIFQESPPPEILRAFADEDGQPDMQAYYAALGNSESGINWVEVENWVRRSVPRQKLAQMITAGATVSETEVRALYDKQSARAVVEYIGVALKDLAADYEPTDVEIQTFYDSRSGQYMQATMGLAKVAYWEVGPSTTDFDEVRSLAVEVKEGIENGEQTFEDAAAIFSEDGSASRGGDLGTFDRNRMVAPFTEAAFALPVGEISDPIETPFGFHLIEVLEQELEDDEVVKVHARHILLKVEAGEATRDAIYRRVGEFRQDVTSQTFLSMADADSTCEVTSPRPFIEGRDIDSANLPQSSAGSRFVFRADPGQISPVLYTDNKVYIVMAEGLQPAAPRPLADVRSQVVTALKSQQQQAEAEAKLAPAVGRVQAGETMADVASDLGLLHAVTDTINASSNIADIGYATAFNAVAVEAEVGQLVPEVVTNRGVFALSVLWQAQHDPEAYAAREDQLRLVLLQRKQSQAFETWFEQRLAEVKVEDWRDEMAANL